eukprot:1158891-Pelagomonas_calceolata.AAC.11
MADKACEVYSSEREQNIDTLSSCVMAGQRNRSQGRPWRCMLVPINLACIRHTAAHVYPPQMCCQPSPIPNLLLCALHGAFFLVQACARCMKPSPACTAWVQACARCMKPSPCMVKLPAVKSHIACRGTFSGSAQPAF